jgi:DNA mismatch repair ATPase MutS
MKSDLLYLHQSKSANNKIFGEAELVRDLKMDILLDTMANGDPYLKSLCKRILLNPSQNLEEIHMRQEILKEATKSERFFTEVYKLSMQLQEKTNASRESLHPRYDKVIPVTQKVSINNELAGIYITYLELLCKLIMDEMNTISSPILSEFCNKVINTYSTDFFSNARKLMMNLSFLKSNSKIEIGGHVGSGLKLTDIILHTVSNDDTLWKKRKSKLRADAVIPLDNTVLHNNAQEITNSALIWILKTLSRFNEESYAFFERLREMFGFYVATLNLYQALIDQSCVCFPKFAQKDGCSFINLKDCCLILKNGTDVVGNSISNNMKKSWIITGFNQGGKTTFLRSIGLAQLMAQSGMFVTADSLECTIYNGIYSHFPDEEDHGLKKGLLEQELYKLNELIKHMKPGCLLLMNETFSTTTEYDASYLAEQITTAFRSCHITTFFVTHLYEYAHKLYLSHSDDYIFLRTQIMPDGSRSYRIEEGDPLRSSYSIDLYHQIMD